ncbi:hypothetical protein DOY81_014826, partial [Sarcophaga bullata]
SSLKHSSRRSSSSKSALTEFTPEDLLAGQFVVFTVYAMNYRQRHVMLQKKIKQKKKKKIKKSYSKYFKILLFFPVI